MLTSGDLSTTEIPDNVKKLAEALSKLHGPVVVSREASGLHVRMASPICLAQEGS